MATLMVILRVVHVVSGIYVAGSYLFLVPILEPRLKRLGSAIQSPVMRSLMPILTPVNGLSFIILLGTGVAMTLILRWGALNTLFVTGWGWAMIVGLVATVAASVVGFGILMPTGLRMERLGRSFEGRAPKPEEGQQIQQLSARVETLSRVNFALIMIALATMIISRYV
jgi:hypothetical protein